MRYSLAHNHQLSTQHLLALIDNPKLAWPLGSYRKKAQALVTQLENLDGAAAPGKFRQTSSKRVEVNTKQSPCLSNG